MTKLQELIGLIEKANRSKNWAYYLEFGKNAYLKKEIVVDRYPIEDENVQYQERKLIIYICRDDADSALNEACAKMRELIKEEKD